MLVAKQTQRSWTTPERWEHETGDGYVGEFPKQAGGAAPGAELFFGSRFGDNNRLWKEIDTSHRFL